MDRLRRFVAQHGNVSIVDTQGRTRTLPPGDPDVPDLLANADRFLWDGYWRGRPENGGAYRTK